MGLFKPSTTFASPASGSNAQRGFPAPGDYGQTTGPARPQPQPVLRQPIRETKGKRTFFKPAEGSNAQRGFPTPLSRQQAYPDDLMNNSFLSSGLPTPVYTPYYSRGAAAYVQNYGKVLYDPIGSGVYAPYRPQAYYAQPGEYDDSAIWWTSQIVPTNVNLVGLNNPDVMNAILGQTLIEAVVRTTG
jgi:hypothetical protein